MQTLKKINDNLFYLGGNDRRLALFEGAIPIPRGVSYNSYLLSDEKTVLFDTVDGAVEELFLENLACALGGRPLDYLVVHHVEPDHSQSFLRTVSLHPETTVVANAKSAAMLKNFYGFEGKLLLVKEGEELSVGARTLRFVFAPMVHWPEVMMTYIPEDGILFSADAFGTFGALHGALFADEVAFERDFLSDARKYYFNIVGKYGLQVQSVLKKAAGLDIRLVCPLHGPVWRKDFSWCLAKYDLWSRYLPEERGVAIFYGSVYGHTKNAAEMLASMLAERGTLTAVHDVSATHVCDLLPEAFRYSHLVFASSTYNNGIFMGMEHLLSDLKAHLLRDRKYAIVENGSWAPQAGTLMQEELLKMRNMSQIGEKITILSAPTEKTKTELENLAALLAEDIKNS